MFRLEKAGMFVCLVLCCLSSFGQVQVVRTLDKDSKLPIEGVRILNKRTGVADFTNLKGEVTGNFHSSDSLLLQMLGYDAIETNYSFVQANENCYYLKANSIALSQMVVSGTKRKQSSDRISGRILKVPISSLTISQTQTTADLLGNSGEVYIQKSQQGGGSPMIRGFSTNRLLYSVDGVRMNTAIFRSGNLQNVISLDPYAMQNVEVFLGPGSVIYGSDAVGGVMSFETIKPRFADKEGQLVGRVALKGKTANWEQTGHFDLRYGQEKWAGVTSVTYSSYDDLLMGAHGPKEYLRPNYVMRIDGKDSIVASSNSKKQTPSGYSQTNVMQKLSFVANNNLLLHYGFHYSKSSTYDRYDRLLQEKNGALKYGEWKYGPQVWVMNNLRLDNTKGTPLYDRYSLTLAQQYFEESRISRSLNSTEQKNRIEKVDAYSMNFDLVKHSNRHTVYYGAEYVLNKVNSRGVNRNIETLEEQGASSRYPNSDWESIGVYANDAVELSEALTLQAGLRWNRNNLNAVFDTTYFALPFTESVTKHSGWTGSLGMVYSDRDDLKLRLNVARGFRAPNVDDIGKIFDSEPGSVVVPNPNLDAEKVHNIEAGVTGLLGEAFKLDFSVYYTFLNDAMVRRDYTLNGKDSMMYDGEMSQIQAIQNAAKAHVYGLEFGGEFSFTPEFNFRTQLNWQKGEEELDSGETSPSRHAAPLFGFSAFRYQKQAIQMELKCRYNAEVSNDNLPEGEKEKDYIYAVDSNGNPYSPAWYAVDFTVLFQASKKVDLSLVWENVTNQRYRPYSSGLVASGSSVGFSMDFRF